MKETDVLELDSKVSGMTQRCPQFLDSLNTDDLLESFFKYGGHECVAFRQLISPITMLMKEIGCDCRV